ncbi:hypothetical protein BC828DRAFT_208685 [Blastocladiella britannica]|nr:hypothetical protein BC828DRAFT_208685 [Blastocladiella britannica]
MPGTDDEDGHDGSGNLPFFMAWQPGDDSDSDLDLPMPLPSTVKAAADQWDHNEHNEHYSDNDDGSSNEYNDDADTTIVPGDLARISRLSAASSASTANGRGRVSPPPGVSSSSHRRESRSTYAGSTGSGNGATTTASRHSLTTSALSSSSLSAAAVPPSGAGSLPTLDAIRQRLARIKNAPPLPSVAESSGTAPMLHSFDHASDADLLPRMSTPTPATATPSSSSLARSSSIRSNGGGGGGADEAMAAPTSGMSFSQRQQQQHHSPAPSAASARRISGMAAGGPRADLQGVQRRASMRDLATGFATSPFTPAAVTAATASTPTRASTPGSSSAVPGTTRTSSLAPTPATWTMPAPAPAAPSSSSLRKPTLTPVRNGQGYNDDYDIFVHSPAPVRVSAMAGAAAGIRLDPRPPSVVSSVGGGTSRPLSAMSARSSASVSSGLKGSPKTTSAIRTATLPVTSSTTSYGVATRKTTTTTTTPPSILAQLPTGSADMPTGSVRRQPSFKAPAGGLPAPSQVSRLAPSTSASNLRGPMTAEVAGARAGSPAGLMAPSGMRAPGSHAAPLGSRAAPTSQSALRPASGVSSLQRPSSFGGGLPAPSSISSRLPGPGLVPPSTGLRAPGTGASAGRRR